MTNKAFLAGFALLTSVSVLANLPDEINYSPYYSNYTETRSDRDLAQSNLNSSEALLEDILITIDDKQDYISLLVNQISSYQGEIRKLERELPIKQSELRSTDSDIDAVDRILYDLSARKQRVTSKVNNQRRALSPVQNELKQKQKLIRNIHERLVATRTKIENKQLKVKSNVLKIEKNKKEIVTAKSLLEALNKSKATLESKVSASKKEVVGLTNKKTELKTRGEALKKKHSDLKQVLSKEQQILKQLISTNADAEKVKAQRKVVTSTRSAVTIMSEKMRSVREKVRQISSNLVVAKTELNTVKTALAQLPSKISSQQRIIKTAKTKNQALSSNTNSLRKDIKALVVEKDNLVTKRSRLERRIADLSTQENTIKEEIITLTKRLQGIDSNIVNANNSKSRLVSTQRELVARVDFIKSRLPSLARSISSNNSEISNSRAQIRKLKQDENLTRRAIARQELELENLQDETYQAYAKYKKRQDLYDHYSDEAQKIGANQTDAAYALGDGEGESLADSISSSVSSIVAADYGKTQATLIGYVRGEIDGYRSGYASGYTDSGTISQATDEASQDATDAAYNYAAVNFAPEFFENYMLAELKQDVGSNKNKNLSLRHKSSELSSYNKKMSIGIEDLSELELSESRNLVTSMDSKIIIALQEEQRAELVLSKMRIAREAYERPQNIPYQAVSCHTVYKGLDHFKEVCKESYRFVFEHKFLTSTLTKFKQLYTSLFDQKFANKEPQTREEFYQIEFDKSSKVAFAEAKILGKKDVFQVTYNDAYTETYDFQLPIAREFTKEKAKVDVSKWITENPVVTIESSKYQSKTLRGGDTGTFLIDLKNISKMKASEAAMVDVTGSQNLEFSKGQFLFSEIDGRVIKQFAIPFKVSATVSSKDQVIFNAKVNLPGDKYKSRRIEGVNLAQGLAVNPKADSTNRFDTRPNIKRFRKYLIHSFQVEITPMIENVKDGYDISLTPVGVHSGKVNMKISSVKTKKLNRGEVQKVKLKYSFSKTAKKKNVEFDLIIKYKDILIKSERIVLTPR